MNAKEDEIKKQYKKLALKWHPDRNHGQEELATKNFKEISSAYAVLSDPQERKWYDDHREAILRGGDGTKGDSDGQSINIFKYFNSSCYNGPEDGLYGFFGVYKGVFEKIDLQEINGKSGEPAAPLFGDSSSPIADVLRFYSYWENFATKLNFSWEDKYNVLDAPNRQTKRAMEKENQKFRDAGRKEYTAEVRSLAAFVKKRDRRYLAYEAEVQQRRLEEEARKTAAKAEEALRRKEAREARMAQVTEYTPEELEQRERERSRAFLLADNDSDAEDEEAGEGGASGGCGEDGEFYTEEELQAKLREMRLKEQQQRLRGDDEGEGSVAASAGSGGSSGKAAVRKEGKLSKKEKKKAKARGGLVRSVFRAAAAAADEDEGEEEEEGEGSESEPATPPTAAAVATTKSAATSGAPSVSVETVDSEEDNSGNEDEEDDEGVVLFRCDVCSKSFKSEAQLNQHLASSVHRKKVKESQKKQGKKK